MKTRWKKYNYFFLFLQKFRSLVARIVAKWKEFSQKQLKKVVFSTKYVVVPLFRSSGSFLKLYQKLFLVRTIKGQLRYKTITSQNVLFEAQVKSFFISYESYVRFSRYSIFWIFNYPRIYQICDVMMSISTRCIFEYIFWTTTHKVTKLCQLIDTYKGNNF